MQKYIEYLYDNSNMENKLMDKLYKIKLLSILQSKEGLSNSILKEKFSIASNNE